MASADRDDSQIASQYSVDTSRRLPSVGGLAAFAASDRASGRTDLMAVALDPRIPARPSAFQLLITPIPGLLTPLAYLPMGGVCYAICLAPPGPAVQTRSRPWSDAELLQCVLRPAAHVLVSLRELGITHRGIRLDNVFQAAAGQPVVLGTAWTAPAAMAQPALFEPPYSAMCLAAGRGEGTIADDVYALGVLLLCLALGHAPLAELDDNAIIQRKLAVGSFEAVVGNERLSPIIGDLLAEDPEHRPTPSLLLDPASARARRVTVRPPRRAQRPLAMPCGDVWNVRSLAHAVAVAPDEAARAVRSNAIEYWLRRDLGDAQLAARVEDTLRDRARDLRPGDKQAEGALLLRLVALLDPLAPLCWKGLAVWPDGLGTALAVTRGTNSEAVSRLEEIVLDEQTAIWGLLRADRCDAAALRVEARQHHSWWQQSGHAGGASRLEQLQRLSEAGYLSPMLRLLEDPVGHNDDTRGAQEARLALQRIDAELAHIAEGAQERASAAVRVGQEVAAGFGLAALAAALVLAALG
jgi:hypothetical protein